MKRTSKILLVSILVLFGIGLAPAATHAAIQFPASFTASDGTVHNLIPNSEYTSTGDNPQQCAKYDGFGDYYSCANADGTFSQCFVGPNAVPSCTTPKAANGDSVTTTQVGNDVTTNNTDATTGKTTATVQQVTKQCDAAHLDECLRQIPLWFMAKITSIFLMFATVLVYLGGAALNWTIYLTIFQFGNLVGNNSGLLAAWGVLRDIGNMLLLFGFIFMGISTILNLPGNEFTAKRALPGFIIFAVLMNFSLFSAEAVIDVSNAFGTTFYRQISAPSCPSNANNQECATSYGIGAAVMTVSGLGKLFDESTQKQIGDSSNDTQVVLYLFLSIFAVVTAFVFFAGAFMFIIRMVVLAFIMVTSPIGFAGMAIPPLHETASNWWKALLSQSFSAPVYLLMILVSVQFMSGIIKILGNGAAVSLASVFLVSKTPTFSIFVIFCLVIAFMLAAVKIAQDMGAMGAGFATSRAGALSFGAIGFVGRRTVGQASFGAARALRGSRFGDTFVGRQLLKGADYGAKATFDARGIDAVKKAAGGQHIELGNIPKNAQHGYEGIAHARGEEIKKHAEKMTLSGHDRHEHLAMRLANRELEREIGALELQRDEADRQNNVAERDRLNGEITGHQNRVRENRIELARLDRSLFERRRDFANNLDNDWFSRTVGRVTGGREFDEEGVHEIREWLAKSPRDKLIDDLKKATEGDGGNHDAGHGGAPAAGGPAPAGGHGPAAH